MMRALPWFVVLAVACSDNKPFGTTPTPDDGGVDTPAAVDAQTPTDRGAAVDNAQPADAPRDVTAPRDAAPDARPSDAPSPADVSTPIDASPRDVTAPRDADATPPADDGPSMPPPDAPPADVTLPSTELYVPAFDAATLAHLREVRARGVAMGARPNVFAKIGDSITESASFLSDVGFGWHVLAPEWSGLQPTIDYFRSYHFSAEGNPFNRASVCAMGGWTATNALFGEPMSPLRDELARTRPAYALVMYGTNDLDHISAPEFIALMGRIVDIIEGAGAVAAVSTIPDRLDNATAGARVAPFNDAIRAFASTRHLPLMEYWRAMQPLPRHGVEADGIHPSVYVRSGDTVAGFITPEGLNYGYNMRNLVALVMLQRLTAAR